MGIEALAAMVVSNIVLGVWEYFLGKTEKIDANSTAELCGNAVKKLIKG